MKKIADNLLSLVGNTPLVRLSKFSQNLPGDVLGKLELANPCASVKDRIALAMIEDAEKSGKLKKGATIIEPTSGNTGIGIAFVAAVKDYHVILTMPESMSAERRKLLKALGAEIILTDAQDGMEGAINEAQKLLDNIEGSFMPQQFSNPANPQVHYRTTGPEIWEATEGKVDILVAGVGTGGTISGGGRFLKEKNPDIKIVAVEPEESAVLSGKERGPHMIQGIGAGFIPENMDMSIVDEIQLVKSNQAIEASKQLAKMEGLLVGISSGANAYAARLQAEKPENKGKQIVTIMCDTGERYLSTLLFFED